MIIARQCMFIIIVIGSYFMLKWCKIIFSCFRFTLQLTFPFPPITSTFSYLYVACLMKLLARDLTLSMCQQEYFCVEENFLCGNVTIMVGNMRYAELWFKLETQLSSVIYVEFDLSKQRRLISHVTDNLLRMQDWCRCAC